MASNLPRRVLFAIHIKTFSDRIDGIMERKLGKVLDVLLVESYLKLDTDQLTSRKISSQFNKVR
jgi:hypothetical protein